VIQPVDVLPELDALAPGEAVFDLDGTLLLGDVGEAAAGLLDPSFPPPGYAGMSALEQSLICCRPLRGLRFPDVERVVDDAFRLGLVAPNPPVVALAQHVAVRHRVWILTGSPEVVGLATAPRLGLRHVMGIQLRWDGDVLTDDVIPPVPVYEGKVATCEARLGVRPVFAIGNTAWDFPVLAHARVARTTGLVAGERFPAFP
jgi:phosphoserine phosphatase